MGNFNKDINLKLLPFGTKLTYERCLCYIVKPLPVVYRRQDNYGNPWPVKARFITGKQNNL